MNKMSAAFHNEQYGFRFTYNILKNMELFNNVIVAFDKRPQTEQNLDSLILDMQEHRADKPKQQQSAISNNCTTGNSSVPPNGGFLTAEEYESFLRLNRRYSFYLGLDGTSASKPGELPKVEPYYSKCLADFERNGKEIRAKQEAKKHAHRDDRKVKAIRKAPANMKKTITTTKAYSSYRPSFAGTK